MTSLAFSASSRSTSRSDRRRTSPFSTVHSTRTPFAAAAFVLTWLGLFSLLTLPAQIARAQAADQSLKPQPNRSVSRELPRGLDRSAPPADSIPVGSPESSQEQHGLIIEEPVRDFGSILQGGEPEFFYLLRNTSTRPIEITRTHNLCGKVALVSPTRIGAGETAPLRVAMRTAFKSWRSLDSVRPGIRWRYLGEKDSKRLTCELRGTVLPLFENPNELRQFHVVGDPEASCTVRLRQTPGTQFEIDSVSFAYGKLVLEAWRFDDGILEVSYRRRDDLSNAGDKLLVSTTPVAPSAARGEVEPHSTRKAVYMAASIDRRDRVHCRVRSISLYEPAGGRGSRREIEIEAARAGIQFDIEKVTVRTPGESREGAFQIETRRVEDAEVETWCVSVALVDDSLVEGERRWRGELVIETTDPQSALIPIRLLVNKARPPRR